MNKCAARIAVVSSTIEGAEVGLLAALDTESGVHTSWLAGIE
jgi:hypothetical protein